MRSRPPLIRLFLSYYYLVQEKDQIRAFDGAIDILGTVEHTGEVRFAFTCIETVREPSLFEQALGGGREFVGRNDTNTGCGISRSFTNLREVLTEWAEPHDTSVVFFDDEVEVSCFRAVNVRSLFGFLRPNSCKLVLYHL